jgi:hypothetical protein
MPAYVSWPAIAIKKIAVTYEMAVRISSVGTVIYFEMIPLAQKGISQPN